MNAAPAYNDSEPRNPYREYERRKRDWMVAIGKQRNGATGTLPRG